MTKRSTHAKASFPTTGTIVVLQWADNLVIGIGKGEDGGGGQGGRSTRRHGRALGEAARSAVDGM